MTRLRYLAKRIVCFFFSHDIQSVPLYSVTSPPGLIAHEDYCTRCQTFRN